MTLGLTSVGYSKVELSAAGKIKTMSVHRLVATAFVANPHNLPVVHHKDEVKTNNMANNLEWTSHETNVSDWFDKRRITLNLDMIKLIGDAIAAGKDPSEILSSLPRKRKARKT